MVDMRTVPLVSVTIPAYNAAPYIRQTLESVLFQTYRNLEVIVVDDGSQDETGRIVEYAAKNDDRVILLRQPNQGVAEARNAAIKKSRGEYIAPIDADDLWHPEKIERQVQCILQAGPLHLACKAISKDLAMIFSPQMVKLMVRIFLGIAGKSVTSRLRYGAQLNFEQKSSFRNQWKCILSEIEKDNTRSKGAKSKSIPWKRSNPYDRICVQRWQQVTKFR
jgi:glycosyltransferase involved in cell wall biosynthesis